MRNSFLRSLALAALTLPVAAFAGTKHSLVITLDGTRADTLLSGHHAAVNALIANAWAPGYKTAWTRSAQTAYDADTWSGPNHGAIMTGVTGGTLGITNNGTVGSANWAQFPHYLKRVETAAPAKNTAYLVTWSTDFTDIPYGADFGLLGTDETNTTVAEKILAGTYSGTGSNGAAWTAGRTPDAVFLFLDDPDHGGHTYGFDPDTLYVADVSNADSRIGRLLAAIKSRPNFANEDWQIVITSDHGGLINGAHDIGALPSASTTDANQTTVPLLVVSKTALAGEIAGAPRNYDAAPTALTHLGIAYPTTGTGALQGVVRGDAVYPVAPAWDTDLVANLKFDGDYADASGRGNSAAPMGANPPVLLASGGKFGGCLRIQGAGSYATFGDRQDLRFDAAQDHTFTIWFRVAAVPASDAALLANKDWNSGKNTGFVLSPGQPGTGTGAKGVGFNAGDGTDRVDANAIAYAPGEWVFAAVTVRKGGAVTVYSGGADGVLRSVSTLVGAVDGQISGLPLNIGQDGTGAYAVAFTGEVDDLGAWRRALSPDEVSGIYTRGLAGQPLGAAVAGPAITTNLAVYLKGDGALVGAAGTGVDATVLAGTPQYTPGKFGQAFRFLNNGASGSGPSDWAASLGNLDALYAGDFSVSLWERTASAADAALMGNKNWSSGSNPGWVVSTLPNKQVNWNAVSGSRRDVNLPGFSDGAWHHVVVTVSRATGQVLTYKDGVLVATKDISPSATGVLAAGYPTLLGASGPGTWAGTGDLDDVAIWTRVLTPAEIGGVHTRGQAGEPLAP